LGSSLTVTPASKLPQKAKTLVIVNLQKTPVDNKAKLRIFAPADKVMKMLLKKMEVKVEKWSAPPPSEMRKYYLQQQKNTREKNRGKKEKC